MVALLLAAAGCRILYLGTEVPLAQVAGLVKDLSVRAVAVSVSQANRSEGVAAQIALLRELMPRRVTLLVGGRGAPFKGRFLSQREQASRQRQGKTSLRSGRVG